MPTIRETTLQMLDVFREHILKTGEEKYNHLEGTETIDKIADAGMAFGFLWGEMQKRLDEIAVKAKYGGSFDQDLLKLLHEGLMLLAHRHPEIARAQGKVLAPESATLEEKEQAWQRWAADGKPVQFNFPK